MDSRDPKVALNNSHIFFYNTKSIEMLNFEKYLKADPEWNHVGTIENVGFSLNSENDY